MKKSLFIIGTVILVLFLSACGEKDKAKDTSSKEPNTLDPLEVALNVPETGEKNKPIELKATVKQKKELVDDASEVQFEIWKDGAKEDSEIIDAANKKDGKYTANYTFKEDAVYTVQVHVTARQQHQMPTKKIAIDSSETTRNEHEGHSHGDEHHASDLSFHFIKPEKISKNTDTELAVHLEKDGKPLTEANVRYEISKDDVKKHAWVATQEIKTGQYKATYAFKNAGKYTVQIHVENDKGLHEHEHYTLTVE
ncbi:FixH family protein [Aciduricibacillus chroicocephali]|uniref:FixH family protein n=1 Tax=Aciduricibacillus chroicocephali TaxID=3054939 RepID=A0ABY9KUL6_9BACI|nr:FixH family protein [Bacillaceae bacterium 44XB]